VPKGYFGTCLNMKINDRMRKILCSAGPLRSPILGFLSIYAYTLCRRTTKFDVLTLGRVVSWVSYAPPTARKRGFVFVE